MGECLCRSSRNTERLRDRRGSLLRSLRAGCAGGSANSDEAARRSHATAHLISGFLASYDAEKAEIE